MGYISYSTEVDKCFKENPQLKNKTLKQIAEFFIIQGELKYSLLREANESKLNFYRMRLSELDPEYLKKLDKEWEAAAHLEAVDE